MLLRNRIDPTIIAAMARGTDVAIKIKSSDRFSHTEPKVGTMFTYRPTAWSIVDLKTDIDARLHYAAYKAATGNASLPPMD